MSIDVHSLLDQALTLSSKKRALLAERLWESLEDDTQEDVQQAWLKEIRQRVAELRSGKVKPIPGKKAMQAIRKDILKK